MRRPRDSPKSSKAISDTRRKDMDAVLFQNYNNVRKKARVGEHLEEVQVRQAEWRIVSVRRWALTRVISVPISYCPGIPFPR
jgi:hypothetical protein